MAWHEVADTPSYLDFPFRPLEAGLASTRTYGYPLFLEIVLGLTGSKQAVPWAQYAVHVLCVICWYFGARNWFPRASHAAIAAASLLVTHTLLRNVSTLATDSLASSFAIGAIGMLMAVVASPRKPFRWILLTALVFAAYQVRPAYLFLVPLCPVLGTGLLLLRRRLQPDRDPPPLVGPWRLGGYLAGIALAPLLLFCLVRGAVVGDFGLVSFTGYNFCGVVGQFLDRSTVSCLPVEVQPVAEEALLRRIRLAEEIPGFSGDVVTSYITIENRFDVNTALVFPPAARTVSGGDPVETNRLLVRLATGIIRCHPKLYALWLAKAWVRGIYIIVSELAIHPLVLVLLPLLLLIHFASLSRRKSSDPTAAGHGPRDMELPLNALLLVAILFAVFKLLFVIPTTPPLGRFMDAAGVFWLPWFCLVFVDRCRTLRRHCRNAA